MSELLEAERQRTVRAGHQWSVVMLDIDHFKQVNDLHGHAGGDAVLRAVARTAQAAIRGSDTLARWGGEEFVVLLRDTGVDAARDVAERLRADLAALALPIGVADWHVTISGGDPARGGRGRGRHPVTRRQCPVRGQGRGPQPRTPRRRRLTARPDSAGFIRPGRRPLHRQPPGPGVCGG